MYDTSLYYKLQKNDDNTFTVKPGGYSAASHATELDGEDDGVLYTSEKIEFWSQVGNNTIETQIEGFYTGGYVVHVDDEYIFLTNMAYSENHRFSLQTTDTGHSGLPICFLKGTMISTASGETRVECLQIGDEILTASKELKTIKWVGFRKFNRARIPESSRLRTFPVRIVKGAFAENVPHRDLTVSPGHRFNFDGALVPALSLVNGITIIQDFDVQQFEYYHVELEKFDMLIAEGAVAESYLEVGDNRNSFQNANTVAANPDFGPAPERVFLPEYVQKITSEIIQPIRLELFKRAEVLMGAARTADTNLRIEVNGQVIQPNTPCKKKGLYRFELPSGYNGDIHILSNSAVVRETSLINRTDMRVIGVGLSGIALVVDGMRREINLNVSTLSGFNESQEMEGMLMRWTTGEAVIPAGLVPATKESVILELNVLRAHMYWVPSIHTERARKAA